MLKKGYVLPVTLMIMSIAIALLTSVMNRSFVYQDTISFELKRERLRLLANSGIQIAMAQVALILPDEKKGNDAAAKPADKKGETVLTPAQQWITQLMPIINSWQTFKLTEAVDGIDGSLQLYIACEQGKFNITRMYDILNAKSVTDKSSKTTKNEPEKKSDGKKTNTQAAAPQKNWGEGVAQLLEQNSIVGFSKALTAFKAAYGRPPEDGVELATQEAVKAFKTNIFPSPDNKSILKTPLFLMDLFTSATATEKMNPWLLSSSVAALLGLKRNKEKFDLKEKIKEVKPFTNWSQQWNKLLEPVYGKKFENIPKEISSLFAASFDATVCSVICIAQMQGVSQKVYAIIEKMNPPEGISPKSVIFKIKRMYWL